MNKTDKSQKKIKLEDLYFGVKVCGLSYSSIADRNKLETINLFGSMRVLWSVAMWVTMTPEERAKQDFLGWCFSDVRGRTEYEFIVCPWPYREDDTIENVGCKVDVFTMYVQPNEKYLRQLVESVTKTSAKRWLTAERKRRKEQWAKLKS